MAQIAATISQYKTILIGALYGIAYAGLFLLADKVSGLAGFSLWFPAAGLRFALIFVIGWRFGIVAAVTEILVQGALGQWSAWHYSPAFIILGIGIPPLLYALVIGILQKYKLAELSLSDFSQVLWLCIAMVIAPAITAPTSSILQVMGGRMPMEAMLPAIFSFWVGDMIGLLMLAPILLGLLRTWPHKGMHPPKELSSKTFLAEIMLASLFIWLAAQYAEGALLSLRWLPFLAPVLAIALRYGFFGASLVVLALNLVIVGAASQLQPYARFDLQIFLAIVSFTGLLIGGLVTAKAHAKKALADQFKTLAHLDRMNTMGEMAAHIIHELAQPIHTTSLYAKGAVKMLERGELDREGLLDTINMAANETSRMQELIHRMKAFARKGELVLEETTAQKVVGGISHMIDLAAKQQGVNVEYDLPKEALALTVDVIQVQQAILNLARNGIEAMETSHPKTLTIKIGLTENSDTYFCVSDTGPGLPNDLISGETTKKSGMGVGLKIVEAIVEAHGGTLITERNCVSINL